MNSMVMALAVLSINLFLLAIWLRLGEILRELKKRK